MTLAVPSRIAVTWTDAGGVYDSVVAYAAESGLARDAARSVKAQGTYVSQRVRCAPNGDERHTAWCVFSFTVALATDTPNQTTVSVKVSVLERVEYDPKEALQQVRIEPVLDRLTTHLRNAFGVAVVAQTAQLSF